MPRPLVDLAEAAEALAKSLEGEPDAGRQREAAQRVASVLEEIVWFMPAGLGTPERTGTRSPKKSLNRIPSARIACERLTAALDANPAVRDGAGARVAELLPRASRHIDAVARLLGEDLLLFMQGKVGRPEKPRARRIRVPTELSDALGPVLGAVVAAALKRRDSNEE